MKTILLIVFGFLGSTIAHLDMDFHGKPKSYTDAVRHCAMKNQRLLYTAYAMDVEAVLADLQNRQLTTAWIGVDRLATQSDNPPFQWKVSQRNDLSVATDLWGFQEPGNVNGNKRCVRINQEVVVRPGSAWEAVDCGELNSYYCVRMQ